MHHHTFLSHTKRALAILSATVMVAASSLTAFAAASEFKLSDIDLKVTLPEELVCFTRSTTNNNAYLEKIGVESAAELRASMESANVYLEAVDKDITYEIVISSQKASSELSDFNISDSTMLNELFEQYVSEYQHLEGDAFTEDITSSSMKSYNGTTYFVTDITNVSKTMVTVYSRKYYTVMQGNVYTFSIQSKTNELTDALNSQLLSVVQSAEYVPIKKSIFENSIVTEVMSSIITLGVPIAILALIAFLLGRKKKGH